MYFAELRYKKLLNKGAERGNSISLVLESPAELNLYIQAVHNRTSAHVTDAWFKMQENVANGRSLGSHLGWQGQTYTVASLVVERRAAETGKDEISLVEYADEMNSIHQKKYESMLEMIYNHGAVRVNYKGAYCGLDLDFFRIETRWECDSPEMLSKYLLDGQLLGVDIDVIHQQIKAKVLVIENDHMIEDNLYVYINEVLGTGSPLSRYVFNDFKDRTHFYELTDYIEMFSSAIDHGLQYIFLDTTFSDVEQFDRMKAVIKHVMTEHSDRTLEIHILHSRVDTDEVTSDLPNVNVINSVYK